MKKIYYWNDESNFGDLLNIRTVPKILNCKMKWSSVEDADFLCIGSLMGHLIKKYSVFSLLKRIFFPYFIIGVGSIDGIHELAYQYIPRCNWLSVRGKLTRKILSEKFHQDMTNCLVGDLGILTCDYYENLNVEKKYKFGIVLHHSQDIEKYSWLADKYNLILIDVSNEVDIVIEQMLSSRCILSASLHGLIVADSFNIPNKWIGIADSDLLDKQNFKYLDYYSSLDIYNEQPLDFTESILTDSMFNLISDSSAKRKEKIELVKQNLRDCVMNFRTYKSYGLPYKEYWKNIWFCMKDSFKKYKKNLLRIS